MLAILPANGVGIIRSYERCGNGQVPDRGIVHERGRERIVEGRRIKATDRNRAGDQKRRREAGSILLCLRQPRRIDHRRRTRSCGRCGYFTRRERQWRCTHEDYGTALARGNRSSHEEERALHRSGALARFRVRCSTSSLVLGTKCFVRRRLSPPRRKGGHEVRFPPFLFSSVVASLLPVLHCPHIQPYYTEIENAVSTN